METIACEGIKFIMFLFARTTEEVNLVRDYENEIADLKALLTTFNGDFEEADQRGITKVAQKMSLNDLDNAAFDANNVLDEINYEGLRRTIQTRYKIKLNGYFNIPCYTTLAFDWKMAHKINDIIAKCKTINNEAAKVRPFGNNPKPVRETNSKLDDPIFFGREEDKIEILDAITGSNDVLSVLPIVGMGGIGKTTLTRKIFNDPRTKEHFSKRIWVCVSANFDVMTLFKRILELLDQKFKFGDFDETFVQKIANILENQRYLIVLDDFWNEDREYWDSFIKTMEGMNFKSKGNFIIVTTREEKVASLVKTSNRPRRLRSLTDYQCWPIIKKKVFQDKEVTKEFEITGKEIARKCRGLPLAANVIGRVLQGKEIEEWDSILRIGLSNLKEGEKGVLQVLKVSYDRLPSSSVKKCFAYCSLFVKDSVMDREDLIQLWMAVGLLSNNQESEGNTIFNDFLQNSFFQEPKNDDYGNVMSCKMHDFFHDLACLVSKSDDIFRVRHLATTSIGDETQDIKEKDSHLRTLFSTSNVPDKILKWFQHLHVLKLSGAAIEELPTTINKLKRLRYLDVSNNDRLTTLPDSVCELYFLQTLRIHDSVRCLPEDLRFLICLRHLCFVNVEKRVMPREIGRLSSLQTLPSFYVTDEEGRRIDELGKLTNLQGKLKIQNLELVMDESHAQKADMAEKKNIYELHFQWGPSDGAVNANAIDTNDETVLQKLQPHQGLKGLIVEGFRGKHFPSWITNMKFDKLIKIEFQNCRSCEEIPMLCHLPLLKHLNLKNLDSIESIGYGESDWISTSSNYGQETRVLFPSLERLIIRYLPNLREWEDAKMPGMQVFPCLEYLCIGFCENLACVPGLRGSEASLKFMEISHCDEVRQLRYDLDSFQSLEKLRILECKNLQSISYQNGKEGLRSLQSLEIHNCHELSNLPNEMLECSKSLQSLSVRQCQNLTSIPEMSGMESLQSLVVSGCSNLTSFPTLSGIGCLNSLIELEIGGFSNLVQFNSFQYFFDGMEHIKSLEKLKLIGQADWVSLPEQLQHLSSLKEMKIHDFGIKALPDWFRNLSSLEELILVRCEKLGQLSSKEAMERLTKLTKLYIWSCPLLENRCRVKSGSDSEWSKITHIFYQEPIEN